MVTSGGGGAGVHDELHLEITFVHLDAYLPLTTPLIYVILLLLYCLISTWRECLFGPFDILSVA